MLVKLVGTTNGLRQGDIADALTPESMNGMFRSLIVTQVKSNLARIIREEGINILEVDEHLDEISEKLAEKINPTLEEYGLHMPHFYVMTILTPDDDPNFRRMREQYGERYLKVQQERILQAEAEARQKRKIVEADTDVQIQLMKAQADAQAYRMKAQAEADEMRMKGYTYQQETQRQVANAAASNPGNGVQGAMNSLLDVGIGLGVAGQVAKQVTGAIDPVVDAGSKIAGGDPGWECPNCHRKGITSRFCPECGTRCPQEESWTCPECGTKGLNVKFCPNCGHKKPEGGDK